MNGSPQDTIVAVATALGEASIGIIRLSGSRAVSIAAQLFRSPKKIDLEKTASHTAHVGSFGTDEASDDVVLTLFRAPRSYTGEDVVEVSAHGNPYLLQRLVELCLKNGARPAGAGEFTQRAFINGKLDLTQAEAVADLIAAKTRRAQQAATEQLHGHLAARIKNFQNKLLPLLAHVEVGIDHSDEDHDFLNKQQLLEKCQSVREEIGHIMESSRVGRLLRDGLRVAIVGRPNVGKSSLLNALLKQERAIVTPVAGTTRDTIEEMVDWDGVPVRLIDTAGIRHAPADEVERIGIERSQAAMEKADLILCVLDGSRPLEDDDHALIKQAMEKTAILVVAKSDLPKADSIERFEKSSPTLSISSHTGEGIDRLTQAVREAALGNTSTSAEAHWILNTRHQEALGKARDALDRSVEAVKQNAYEECVALDLKVALDALGEIIGETSTEELLGQIFSQFCVGK